MISIYIILSQPVTLESGSPKETWNPNWKSNNIMLSSLLQNWRVAAREITNIIIINRKKFIRTAKDIAKTIFQLKYRKK